MYKTGSGHIYITQAHSNSGGLRVIRVNGAGLQAELGDADLERVGIVEGMKKRQTGVERGGQTGEARFQMSRHAMMHLLGQTTASRENTVSTAMRSFRVPFQGKSQIVSGQFTPAFLGADLGVCSSGEHAGLLLHTLVVNFDVITLPPHGLFLDKRRQILYS